MGYLVRLEQPGGSPVWINPAEVHSVSALSDTVSIVETGGFKFEVGDQVDNIARLLGEDFKEEP